MQRMDSDALMEQYIHRFDHIPYELRYPRPDMQCQRIIHRFHNKDTNKTVEDRCHKLLEYHPDVQEMLSAYGYQYYDTETRQTVKSNTLRGMPFCHCERDDTDKAQQRTIEKNQRIRDANLPQSVPGPTLRSSLSGTLQNFADRPGTEDAFNAAMDFTVGNTPPILLLTGGTGTGKTHLMEAIGRQYLEQGSTVRYELLAHLLGKLRDSFRINEDQSVIAPSYLAEVLLIDDIGLEKPSEWVTEQVTALVDERWRNNRLLVVATNETYETIEACYGPRLASRLYDMTGKVKQVFLTTTDYRKEGDNDADRGQRTARQVRGATQ
jgi:DNA replication protein DnaC